MILYISLKLFQYILVKMIFLTIIEMIEMVEMIEIIEMIKTHNFKNPTNQEYS